MSCLVRFAPEAVDKLEDLCSYIAQSATPAIAAGYLDAIVDHCEGLAVFPQRGTACEDLRPGLRTMSYKKRVVIAFAVDDHAEQVMVLGVFYAGQDYETILTDPAE